MSGDNENDVGIADGRERLPEDAVPLHAIHRPYNPGKEEESDEGEQE